MGIEPTFIAWEAIVLPLYDTCVMLVFSLRSFGSNRTATLPRSEIAIRESRPEAFAISTIGVY